MGGKTGSGVAVGPGGEVFATGPGGPEGADWADFIASGGPLGALAKGVGGMIEGISSIATPGVDTGGPPMAGDDPAWTHSPGEGGISADTIHNIHSEEGVFPDTTATTTSSAEESVPSVSLSPGTFQPFQPGNYPYLMGPRFTFGPTQSYDLNYQPWTQAYWEANNLPMGLMAYNYPGGGLLSPGGTSGVNLPVSAPVGLVGSTAGSTAGSTTSSTANDTRTAEEKAHDEDRDQGGGTGPDGITGNPFIDDVINAPTLDDIIQEARAEIGRYSEDQLRNWNFGDLDPYDTESMIMDEARDFGLLNSETEILRDQLYNNPIGLISALPHGMTTVGERAVAAAKKAQEDRIASIPDVINRAVAIRAAEAAPSGDMERRAAAAQAQAAQAQAQAAHNALAAANQAAQAQAAQAARDRAAQAAAHQRNVAKAAALAAAQAERDRQSRAQAEAAAAADRARAEAIFAADRRNQSSVEAVLATLRGAGSGIGAGAGNRGGIGRLGSGPLGHSADVSRASGDNPF